MSAEIGALSALVGIEYNPRARFLELDFELEMLKMISDLGRKSRLAILYPLKSH
jgi:hypothetical protein